MSERGRAQQWWAIGLLLAITALGFWFRWLYAVDVSFFVDEYLTVRAAERILAQGAPLLPSGNFYSHGLLLSYLEAAVLALGGRAEWLLRLPVVLLSTAALPLVYWLGRRAFSPAAGLVAAALLAVAPEAILWGGRVRMYAPLQTLVLAATIVFYLWVVEERDGPLYPLLFVLAYWAALFHHAEAMLLLPLWGLWALAQRGWRWCLRPSSVAAFGLSAVAILVEVLLRRLGPPVQARVAAGVFEPQTRQYLGATIDWPGVLKVVEPLFLAPLRLPLTLLVLAGLGLLLLGAVRARRGARPPLPLPGRPLAYAYLYALLLPVTFLLLFVVDPEWKSPRYGLMLLPHFFLLAAAVLAGLGRGLGVWLGSRLGPERQPGNARGWWSAAATTVAVLAIVAVSWPGARAATRESVPAYDWAFGYVEAHQQPGDVVITFLCPAAFWHLGRCDYLAAPGDFAGFAVQEGGRWVSGWDGVPILDSAPGLRQALSEAPRAWFVVDDGRFASRYEDDFLQAVWDEMELVAAEQEVLVFRSAGGPLPPRDRLPGQGGQFEGGVDLLGYTAEPQSWAPGDEVSLVLYWQARSPWAQGDTVSVRLVDAAGVLRVQSDGPPLGGLYPAWRWPPGIVLPDRRRLSLPAGLAPGRYRLEVGLFEAGRGELLPTAGGGPHLALDYLWIGDRPAPPQPAHEVEAVFGDLVRLLGYDFEAQAGGEGLRLTLYWQAVVPVERDYTVFVHLVDGAGQIQAQGDGPPLEGGYPSSYWRPGEVIADAHEIDFSGPPGEYGLLAGLYTLADGVRLPVTAGPYEGQDHVPLGPVTWGGP